MRIGTLSGFSIIRSMSVFEKCPPGTQTLFPQEKTASDKTDVTRIVFNVIFKLLFETKIGKGA